MNIIHKIADYSL